MVADRLPPATPASTPTSTESAPSPIVTLGGTSGSYDFCGKMRTIGNARCIEAFKDKPYNPAGPTSGGCITKSSAHADECVKAVDQKKVFTYSFAYPSAAKEVPAPSGTADTPDVPDIPAPTGTPTADPDDDDDDDREPSTAERWAPAPNSDPINRPRPPATPPYEIEFLDILTRDVESPVGCPQALADAESNCESQLLTSNAQDKCKGKAAEWFGHCVEAKIGGAKRFKWAQTYGRIIIKTPK
ncbi:hypothetical protein HDU96_000572 [Phlyctochytrium bullatum]|nr:hypothetical protein HDU96_000572 [Phlyctochytrium bullatum]